MLAAGRAADVLVLDKLLHLLVGPAIDRALRLLMIIKQIVLDQLVRAETGFTCLTIHQRVIKIADMSGSDPDFRIHQNGAVHSDIIRIVADERIPPGPFHVILLHCFFHSLQPLSRILLRFFIFPTFSITKIIRSVNSLSELEQIFYKIQA